jgi:hypothetical protein
MEDARMPAQTPDRIRPIASLKTFLFEPVMPLWRYCLLAALVDLVPTIFLLLALYGLLRFAGVDLDNLSRPLSKVRELNFFGAVILAPVVETYLLAGFITLLRRTSLGTIAVVIVSAIVWGGLHALARPLAFFGTVWGFFVLSCAYVAWRKVSFKHAYVAAAVPHALTNLVAFALTSALK